MRPERLPQVSAVRCLRRHDVAPDALQLQPSGLQRNSAKHCHPLSHHAPTAPCRRSIVSHFQITQPGSGSPGYYFIASRPSASFQPLETVSAAVVPAGSEAAGRSAREIAMATFLAAGAVGKAAKLQQDVTATKAQQSRVLLSMYSDLPDGEIAIEEFERFAMDRLRGELPERAAASHAVPKGLSFA